MKKLMTQMTLLSVLTLAGVMSGCGGGGGGSSSVAGGVSGLTLPSQVPVATPSN